MAKKNKKKFNPNEPYEEVKIEFDPELPYEEADESKLLPKGKGPETIGEAWEEIKEDVPKAMKSFPIGLGEEIRGLLSIAGPETAMEYLKTGDLEPVLKKYRETRDKATVESHEGAERSPVTSILAAGAADTAISLPFSASKTVAKIGSKIPNFLKAIVPAGKTVAAGRTGIHQGRNSQAYSV